MAHLIIIISSECSMEYEAIELNWVVWNAKIVETNRNSEKKLNENRYIPVGVLDSFPLPLPGSKLEHFNNIFSNCRLCVCCCCCNWARQRVCKCSVVWLSGWHRQATYDRQILDQLTGRLVCLPCFDLIRFGLVWFCPLNFIFFICAYVFLWMSFFKLLNWIANRKLLNCQQFDRQYVNNTTEISNFQFIHI